MKKMWIIAGVCVLFSCTANQGIDTPVDEKQEIPIPEPDPDDEEEGGDDDPGTLPSCGEWELTDDDTLPAYDGSMADDASLDAVDTSDDDFWENSSFTNTVRVCWAGDDAEVTAPDGVAVYRDGGHVVVDLASGGVKECDVRLAGSSSDGSLKIYSDKKFRIVLEGLELTSRRGPALNNQSKKRTFLHLEAGSVNTLADAAEYADDIFYPAGVSQDDEDRKGTLFSEGQLIVSGTGSLRVAGSRKHAVATDEYFRMRPGATVVVTEAVKNGIHAKEEVRIDGGLLYVRVAGKASKAVKTDGDIDIRGGRLGLFTSGEACYDAEENDTSSSAGLKSDGNTTVSGGRLTLKSIGTGGKGINCDGSLTLSDGRVEVVTTGGKFRYGQSLTSSPKGIKADGDILVSGGETLVRVVGVSDGSEGVESKSSIRVTGGRTSVVAYDDAVNAATAIIVEEGWLYGYSVDNDGIDSNGTISVSGGVVIASGNRQPEDGFDCDRNSFTITGGVLIGTGGGSSTPTASGCTQPSVICNGISAREGNLCCLADAEGTPLAVFAWPRTMESVCLFLSVPAFSQGVSYSLSDGGGVSGAEAWNGYYGAAEYAGGEPTAEFTLTSMVTSVGNSSGGGGWPGGGGHDGPGGGGRP